MYERNLSLEDVCELINELKNIGKNKIAMKKYFCKQCRITSQCQKKGFNNFKSKIFPTKNSDKIPTSEPTVFDTPKKKNKVRNLCLNCMKILIKPIRLEMRKY